MSLYKDASLVMIPSAYKDGKLYSIRPTDGSGDFTFSRGSNLAATRVDVNGLIEKGRENLLLQSNQFDTTWIPTDLTLTGNQSGYDSSTDAWLLDVTSGTCCQQLRQSVSCSGVNTFSVYVKSGTAEGCLLFGLGSGNPYAEFDLITGTTGSLYATAFDSKIESVGGGWYRCSMSFTGSITQVRIYPADASGGISQTSGSIYIQDAQLEAGLVATDYIETGASTAQAGILEDMPRLDYSGSCPALLLEPQRTNIVTQSEYMVNYTKGSATGITANAGISPEGKSNATYFYCNTTTTNGYIVQGWIGTSGVQYAVSFYAKAKELNRVYIKNVNDSGSQSWFDLSDGTYNLLSGIDSMSIESAGDGWYRCTAVSTSTTTGIKWIPILKGDANEGVYVYGLQIESGSYPTSYIPTYGSSVTRSADTCFNNTDDFAGTDQVTLFAELDNNGNDRSGSFFRFNLNENTSTAEWIFLGYESSKSVRFYVRSNASTSVDRSAGNYGAGVLKIAAKIDSEGNYKLFANGVQISYGSNAVFSPSLNRVNIGQTNGLTNMEDRVKQLVTFPTALTDSECIALTTL